MPSINNTVKCYLREIQRQLIKLELANPQLAKPLLDKLLLANPQLSKPLLDKPVLPQRQLTRPITTANDPVDVFVIDDFNPDRSQPNKAGAGFFNHGETVSQIAKSGGSHAELANQVAVHKYNINRGGINSSRSGAIGDVLDRVIQIAQTDPSKVDAVNISQQEFEESTDSQRVQAKIQKLIDMGIPVVVAAGNDGPTEKNQLATPDAFIASTLKENSGIGNVAVQTKATSFAAPDLAPFLGFLRREGYSYEQIKAKIQQDVDQSGGAIKGSKFSNIFTMGSTITPYLA